MTAFEYAALDARGRLRKGVVHARDEGAARARLSARRFVPLNVAAGAAPAPAKSADRMPARTSRLRARDLALLVRQLATLVRVVPVEEALRTIAAQIDSPKARRIVLATHASVVEGYRLSDAMAQQGGAYPPLLRAMIAAGEGAGALPEILDRMADLLEREQQTRAKLLTALIYPAALALTAITVVILLMIFVVPRVVEQFDSMGQQLPLLTRSVIFVSDTLRHWGWAMLALGAGAGFLTARALRVPHYRAAADAAVLRLPFVGRLILKSSAARLARTLATMTASGLPIVEGLALTARTMGNTALRTATEDIVASIREGGSLSSAMRRTNLFPAVLVNMAANGENSGKLEPMLDSAADYLEREIATVTAAALSLLEPAIILVMGALVAGIVLSILLPILQLNTLVVR